MRTESFPRITVRRIAEVAGLSTSTLLWNYHKVEQLFGAVVKELDARSEQWVRSRTSSTVDFNKSLVLRTRLVAWMLLAGMDAGAVDTPTDGVLNVAVQQRILALEPVSRRSARVFAMLEITLSESVVLMRTAHTNWTEDDYADGIALFDTLRSLLPEAERTLGWSEASSNSMEAEIKDPAR